MMMKKTLLLWLLLPLSGILSAQEVRVIPSLDRNEILIGEQVKMKVRVVHPKGATTSLHLPTDTLVMGVDILWQGVSDSAVVVNDKIRETIYDVVITSFDSAMYTLRNVQARVDNQLYTAVETPHLMVNTVPVDLEHPEQFNDLKEVWSPPFVWRDYLLPVLLVVLAVLLILLFIRYRKHLFGRKVRNDATPLPLKDPYTEAMEALTDLKSRTIGFDQEAVKSYYSDLSDIVRRYIHRVMGIATAEHTTHEILEAFRSHVDKGASLHDLQRILNTADLAKFAKYRPADDEQIALLRTAETFVNEHRPTDIPETGVESNSTAQ